jgi:hypothetical protein
VSIAPRSAIGLIPLLLPLAGCFGAGDNPPPKNQPVFPTGVAVDRQGELLAVVSSNYDLRYQSGALLIADLNRVDTLPADSGDDDPVITDAYVAHTALSSFADRPVFSADGQTVMVSSRGDNTVHAIRVNRGATPSLECAADALGCRAPYALPLAFNDPYDTVLLRQPNDEQSPAVTTTRAVVSHLVGNRMEFLSLDVASTPPVLALEPRGALSLEVEVAAIRSIARSATTRTLYLGLEKRTLVTNAATPPVELGILAEPAIGSAADAVVTRVQLGAQTGALSMRDMVVVPGRNGREEAIVALLRRPDGLVRLPLGGDGQPARLPVLSDVAEVCRTPTGMVLAQPNDNRAFLIVTCVSGTIAVVDADTLQTVDVIQFWGRQPYAAAVRPRAADDEADVYVSFFLDDSVGVMRLLGDGRLIRRGRIGTPTPRPEDGRE